MTNVESREKPREFEQRIGRDSFDGELYIVSSRPLQAEGVKISISTEDRGDNPSDQWTTSKHELNFADEKGGVACRYSKEDTASTASEVTTDVEWISPDAHLKIHTREGETEEFLAGTLGTKEEDPV